MQTRYYSPVICRFISADSVQYLNPESIQGLNLYTYCLNNPVAAVDPDGTIAITILGLLIGAAIGAAIGFGATAYIDYKDDGQIFNGSVAWYDYFGATLLGGVAGGAIGYVAAPSVAAFLGSSFTIAIPSFTMGGGAMAMAAVTITGGQIAAGVGIAALAGLSIVFSKNADRYRPKDSRNNQKHNEDFKRACDRYNLNHNQRDRLHRKISKKGLSYEEIIEIIIMIFGI